MIRIGWLAAALAIGLLLAACAGREGTVQGTVTRATATGQAPGGTAQVGEPVAGAEVVAFTLERFKDVAQPNVYQKTVVAYRGKTAADGTFSFSLAAGAYVVEIWVNEAKAGTRQVNVKAGQVSTADYSIQLP